MQIGEAAQASGIRAKMIRQYEEIGLVPSANRWASNYPSYRPEDVHRLQFIRRARDLGFSMDRIRDLLKLWSDRPGAARKRRPSPLRRNADVSGGDARFPVQFRQNGFL